MLSDKNKTLNRCLHTNKKDAAVPEKQPIDQGTIPTKPTKTIDSWTNH